MPPNVPLWKGWMSAVKPHYKFVGRGAEDIAVGAVYSGSHGMIAAKTWSPQEWLMSMMEVSRIGH